jgi:hypothetical protein
LSVGGGDTSECRSRAGSSIFARKENYLSRVQNIAQIYSNGDGAQNIEDVFIARGRIRLSIQGVSSLSRVSHRVFAVFGVIGIHRCNNLSLIVSRLRFPRAVEHARGSGYDEGCKCGNN